jgi:ABC-type glycerol-3-phosphate transport system permease component
MNRIPWNKWLRLAVIYGLCGVVLFWSLAPIYWVIVSSISTRAELYSAPYKVWFPSAPTLQNYVDLFTTGPRYRDGGFLPTADLTAAGMRNSLIYSLATASIVTLTATLSGYVFARMRFRLKGAIFFFLLLMMPLPIWVSMIALYFIMSQLGLVDNLLGLILITTTLLLPLNVWLMTTYIRDLPQDLEDAAFVDGCERAVLEKISGMRKLFHAESSATRKTAVMPGRDSGMMTRSISIQRPQPSTNAASSRSCGRSRM